jgi:hypothetical protein
MNEEAELRRALRGPLGRRGADAISDAIFETRSRVQRDLDDVRRSVRRLDHLPERIERLRVVVVVAAAAQDGLPQTRGPAELERENSHRGQH